jgi:hypothetical protein
MPYADHLRLTMEGEFSGANAPARERFSLRVNLSDPPTSAPSFEQSRVNDYAADCVALFADPRAGIGSVARLLTVKLAQIGANGKYRSDPLMKAVDRRGNGGGPITHPTQVSLAVSLVTTRRGATGKGRFFLPCPLFGLDGSSLVMDTASVDGVRNALVEFLNNLNNVPGVDAAAPKVTVASSKGYNSDVTAVRVGRALDTIRSRRTSLDENYSGPTLLA